MSEEKKRLRLLLFTACPRDCSGCCNKQWDIDGLEVERDFSKYEMVLLTGGEPLLQPSLVIETISRIRSQSAARIIVYTALLSDVHVFKWVLINADGMTVTLHEQSDVEPFWRLCRSLSIMDVTMKSLRVNIFKGVDLSQNHLPCCWHYKDEIVWIDPCPLPPGEVFKKLG
jgi:hypothetical protein